MACPRWAVDTSSVSLSFSFKQNLYNDLIIASENTIFPYAIYLSCVRGMVSQIEEWSSLQTVGNQMVALEGMLHLYTSLCSSVLSALSLSIYSLLEVLPLLNLNLLSLHFLKKFLLFWIWNSNRKTNLFVIYSTFQKIHIFFFFYCTY